MLYKERIAAAALILDSVKPGWAAKVDLSTLDMEEPNYCVLGQSFKDENENAPYHTGYFKVVNAGYVQNGSFGALHYNKEYWAEEIQKRLSSKE